MQNWLLSREEGVLTVVLNRPQAKNALNWESWEELEAIVRAAAADPGVKVVIVTGQEDSFAAGADVRWLKERPPKESWEPGVQGVLLALENLPKPVIAAVNGYCIGGGLELALACDIRLASTKAKFGFGEINVGIIPGGGGTQRLPRLVGPGWAKQLIFTGKLIDARQALEIGLVNQVVPAEELLAAADALAREMVDKPPLALRLAKQAINLACATDLWAGLAYEKACQSFLHTTADRNEGMSAFLEKRRPVFRGE